MQVVPDRIGAFAAYASIEQDLEPLEDVLFELVSEVDDWLNAELDRQRGN